MVSECRTAHIHKEVQLGFAGNFSSVVSDISVPDPAAWVTFICPLLQGVCVSVGYQMKTKQSQANLSVQNIPPDSLFHLFKLINVLGQMGKLGELFI